MKLQQLFENNSNHILVVRGYPSKYTQLIQQGKPIPVPSRGMSWWGYGKKNDTIDDIIQDFDIRRTYGKGGIIIKTQVSYTVKDNWLYFEPNWGFGVETEDAIPDEIYDELMKQTGIKRSSYHELGFPRIPLKKGSTSFDDNLMNIRNGLICTAPTTKYSIVNT